MGAELAPAHCPGDSQTYRMSTREGLDIEESKGLLSLENLLTTASH